MKVFAYLARSLAGPWRWLEGWRGATVMTCPPRDWREVGPEHLEGYDVLVFKLHGLPGQRFWYGDDWQTALSEGTVREADLGGAVAFVANCHGLRVDGGPGVMVEALLAAGVRAVVAGAGDNYAAPAGSRKRWGADLLGRWFLWGLRVGLGAERALGVAKGRLRVKRMGKAERDALGFRVIENTDWQD